MIRSAASTHGRGNSPPRSAIQFSFPARGELRLEQTGRIADPASPECRQFLDRILPLELIQQVAIHAPRETIEILYPPKCPQNDFLAEFATTLGREAPSGSGFAAGLCLERLRPGPVRIFRNSWGVATWRIAHELPGRIRVRHEELVNHQDAARFIRQKLETAVGVNRAEVSSRTGGALIEFDSDRLTPAQLLYLLESWMRDFSSPAPGGYEHTGSSAVVSHATLGLATAADFILPALAPASAGLLVLTNLKTLRDAAAEIRRMRPGVATLYTTIAGCTLASGFFFSAAMMAWLMHYWDRRYHRRLTDGQRELVLDRRRKPYFVWRCRGSTEVETPVDQLQTGDVIAVRAGEIIPVDGTVESGSARVDEHPVHGVTEWQLRTEGDEVFAASRIQEGGLRIRVSRIGEETRAAVIGDLVELATTPHAAPLKDRGAAHAAQRVPVTLAVAGAGLAVGDLNTALAIMRPDYATGPGMAGPLGTVEDVTRALSVGVVVHRGNLLERLRSADTVVLDQSQGGGLTDLPPHVDPNRWQAEDLKWVDRLCRKLGKRVEIEAWFDSKFVRAAHEFHVAGIRVVEAPDEDAARAERLRHLAKEGRRVVYVGDCARFPQTAALAAVAISTSEIHRDNAFEPDAFLLAPELAHVVSLWELAVREPWRHRLHQAVVAVPNVCCVAGAFLLGFTALHAVVLTNLGTAALYGMRDWRLNHARAARRSLGTKLHSEQPHRPQELPPLPPPEGRVPWRQFASGEYSDSATVAPAPTLCENPPQVDFPTSPVGSVTNAPEDSAPEQETLSALKKLPMSVGAILMGVGVVGVLIPGPLGTPLILAGGLALAPRTFSRFEATFRRKYPGIHRTGLKFLGRFVQDFQNRYPDEFQE